MVVWMSVHFWRCLFFIFIFCCCLAVCLALHQPPFTCILCDVCANSHSISRDTKETQRLSNHFQFQLAALWFLLLLLLLNIPCLLLLLLHRADRKSINSSRSFVCSLEQQQQQNENSCISWTNHCPPPVPFAQPLCYFWTRDQITTRSGAILLSNSPHLLGFFCAPILVFDMRVFRTPGGPPPDHPTKSGWWQTRPKVKY